MRPNVCRCLVVAAILAGALSPRIAIGSTPARMFPRQVMIANTTVFTDDPLVAGVTPVKAEHILQLRAAVNFYRVAASLPAIAFPDDVATDALITAAHVQQLRDALDPARQQLSLPALLYSDLSAGSTPIGAQDVQQLRDAARVILLVCSINVTNPTTTITTAGIPFSEWFTQNGAFGGATFTVDSGTLPDGLNLGNNGLLSGIPTTPGAFAFTVRVTDENGCSATGATYNLQIAEAPSIAAFTATPGTITTGASSTLQGTFTGGTGFITSNPPGTSTSIASGGSIGVSPTTTTVYTLTVTNAAGDTEVSTATVTVVLPPTCISVTFSPSSAQILSGSGYAVKPQFADGVATMEYSVTGGPGFTALPGPFTSGTFFSGPTIDCANDCTAIFSLTVTNDAGSSCNTLGFLAVFSVPAITSFTATATTVATGTNVGLTPVFSGGAGTITPSVGTVSSGFQTNVAVSSSRTFTLTVTNQMGTTVSRSVFVNVNGTLTAGPQLSVARFGATATRLPNGKVLIAGGATTLGGNGQNTAVIYDPVANTYAATGSLGTARTNHTATLLPNGKVLIAGGKDGAGTPLDSLELFDLLGNAGAGTFSPVVATMSVTRSDHTATLLPDGKVLLAGGGGVSTNADLFTPSTSSIATLTGANGMLSPRTGQTATLLPNGKVLLAGGGVVTTELFDWTAATSPFEFGPTLAFAPSGGTATLMANGLVLIAGGTAQAGDVQTYDYSDGATGSLSANGVGGGMGTARQSAAAVLLPDGRVLIAGGTASTQVGTLFDPETSTFFATPTNATSYRANFAVLLGNGKAFISGGSTSRNALLFDPTIAAFRLWTDSETAIATDQHTMTLLPDGHVLVAGGEFIVGFGPGATTNNANLFDPAGNSGVGTFDAAPPLNQARFAHTATLLPNGKVLIAGGGRFALNVLSLVPEVELWDGAAFTSPPGVTTSRSFHSATLLPNGKVLLAGGRDPSNGASFNTADLYDVATGTISAAATMTTPRFDHGATLLPNGKVLIVGGFTTTGATASVELYDPEANSWSTVSTAGLTGFARSRPTVTALPNGKVLIVGGANTSGTPLGRAFLYDWTTNTIAPCTGPVFERTNTTATLLTDGKVLLAAGRGIAGALDSSEIYDFVTDSWSFAGTLSQPVSSHRAVRLGNGKVLITGGLGSDNNAAFVGSVFR